MYLARKLETWWDNMLDTERGNWDSGNTSSREVGRKEGTDAEEGGRSNDVNL